MYHLVGRWRTKLCAEQARVRIRRDVPSFEALLPEAMQIREAFGIAMPVYVWVNQNLTRMHSVLEALKWSGYTYVEPVAGQLQGSDPDGSKQIVQQDKTCPDVLIFPSHVRENLQASPLISEGHLVLQDKSQCLGPQSVLCLFEAGDDVLVVPGCSFPTLAHLCSLLPSWQSHIFVCQPSEDPARTTLNAMCQRLHCKGITLLPEQFLSLAPGDQRLARVSIVLVMPPCSASGINNPVNFILQEGIDPETLPNLCLATTATEEKLAQLSKQQLQLLQHAMCLSGPRAIVYNTCSVYEAENEDVVHTALEIARTDSRINTYQLGPPVLFPWKMDEFGDARESFLKLPFPGAEWQLHSCALTAGTFKHVNWTQTPAVKSIHNAFFFL
uniref:SAM-dependent MTase RsmB/NOP-type domain-containing protein n=1 Tax=Eptatretus burgeri TaxID=7764 RepID=A0A8C4QE69_EPTBU